jgi:hypothetical protein
MRYFNNEAFQMMGIDQQPSANEGDEALQPFDLKGNT